MIELLSGVVVGVIGGYAFRGLVAKEAKAALAELSVLKADFNAEVAKLRAEFPALMAALKAKL